MSSARRVDPIGSQSTITRYFVRHSTDHYPGIAYIHTDSQTPYEISSWPTDGSDVVASPRRPATDHASSSELHGVNSVIEGSGSEVAVSVGNELPADRDIYMPVYSAVETSEALNDSVHWFCRNKRTV